jgi:hypothetical protein
MRLSIGQGLWPMMSKMWQVARVVDPLRRKFRFMHDCSGRR